MTQRTHDAIAIGVTLLLVVGCAVSDAEIKAAEKSCEPHGGASVHFPKALMGEYRVVCKDRTVIEGRVAKP